MNFLYIKIVIVVPFNFSWPSFVTVFVFNKFL